MTFELFPVTPAAHVPAALARLRERATPPPATRLLVHRGACGDASGAAALAARLREAGAPVAETACDGACWAAPAATVVRQAHVHRFPHLHGALPDQLAACLDGRCEDEYAGRGERGLTARLGRHDRTLGEALALGAYETLAAVVGLPPTDVIDLVGGAGILARGGDAGPVAVQWARAREHAGPRTLVVAAGARQPELGRARHLVEGDPHRVVEGLLIAAHAVEADRAVVLAAHLPAEARAVLVSALYDARAAGLLDGSALGQRPVAVELAEAWADDGAVVAHDVETVAALTTALDRTPPPTRLLSLAGAVPRPGVVEVPVDGTTTWAGLLATAGANPYRTAALVAGGASALLVPPERYDEPVTPREVAAGAVLALPLDADVEAVTAALDASHGTPRCGSCAACLEGSGRSEASLRAPETYPVQEGGWSEAMSGAPPCERREAAGLLIASPLLFSEAFAS